jgi:alkanesulfonate monooxygenase SsuD/methylene tetrahydromethanopterin reductase-like flavin-dependent oxidoreductase (luciferase family)
VTRCGILLPSFDAVRSGEPPPIVAAARLAESLGFDAVWVGDHLACPAPGLDAAGVLSAAAAVTERIELGFSVMLLGLRPTAWAAKQLVTIDSLSGGRLLLGVGVGGEFPEEFAAAGVPVAERGARLNESLEVLGDLLAAKPVEHSGRTMQLRIGPLEPPISAIPPVYVGGRGEPALRRAARFGDMWLPMWLEPDVVAERSARLAELAEEQGRPAPGVAMLVGVNVDDDLAQARREAEAHLNGQYRLPLKVVERWTPVGSVERVAEYLEAQLAAGVQELVLMPLGGQPLRQYERLAEVRNRLSLTPAGAPAARPATAPAAAPGTSA